MSLVTEPFHSVRDIFHGARRGIDSERRQCLQFVYYWDELRGERMMPAEDDIDTEHEVIREVWDHCFIVQVGDLANEKLRYTYLGPAIVDAYQHQLSSREGAQMVSLNASKLISAYRQVMATRRPIIHNGEYNEGHDDIIKFRQCLLPFGNDQVDVIFGHMTYQLYPQHLVGEADMLNA